MTASQLEAVKFERELTVQERRFVLPPMSHISMGIRLRGPISKDSLRVAVDKMLVTYPIFRTRIIWNEGDTDMLTTEGAVEVPVRVYERKSDNDWLDVLNKEHAIPAKPSAGGLTRFVLVRSDDVSELFIFCHHSICDGRSLELALREVILHLAKPDRIPPRMEVPPAHTPQVFPQGIKQSRVKSWFLRKLNDKWQKEKVVFDEEDMRNLWEAFWSYSRYRVETVELDKAQTQTLVESCRANGVTVNSAVTVALMRGRIQAAGEYGRKVRTGTAVDTRNRLTVDVGEAAGLYAGGIMFEFDYKHDRPFWDNVRKYHETVAKRLKDNDIFGSILDQYEIDQSLFDGLLVAMIGHLVKPSQSRYGKISEFAGRQKGLINDYKTKSADRVPDVLTTNLGRLGIPEEIGDFVVERALFTPSAPLLMEIPAGAASVAGRLTLTLNYHDKYFEPNRIRKIAEETLRILTDIKAS
jgi:hypothetical protein